jgi:hypothetical protein
MKTKITLAAMLLLIALPAMAQKVYIDWDRTVDFSKYETFAWYFTPETSMQDTAPLMHEKVVEGLKQRLTSGKLPLTLVGEDENPDLLVTYHTEEDTELVLSTDHWGYGYGPGWGWDPYWRGYWGGMGMGTSTTRAYTYTKGTLLVDIWDAKEKQLIWRGSATDTVPENPQKGAKKIDKMLTKMAKKWQKMYRR